MLGSLISTLGFAALKGEATAMAERAGKRAALYVVVGILWLAALGFLVAAITIWLSDWIGGLAACAVIAAVLAAGGLIVQIALMMTARRRRRSQVNVSMPGFSATGTATGGGADVGTLAVIAVMGWLLGRQMTKK